MKEGRSLTIRGLSLILGVPIMITFFNQTNAVSINVASTTEEFKIADYQKLNLSLGQYVDSVELSMYR